MIRYGILCSGNFASRGNPPAYQIIECHWTIQDDVWRVGEGDAYGRFEDKNYPCNLERATEKLRVLRELEE